MTRLDRYLHPTPIADHQHPQILALIERRGWAPLEARERIGAAYDFVRTLPFGYNRHDALPASEVLADGLGQCNTKGNLLIALLRGLGVPARVHGFTIDKALQKGAIPLWLHWLAPAEILHSWVEVYYEGRWVPLEGFIIDPPFLASIQRRYPEAEAFCGFGIATPDLQRPPVVWRGEPTYIQKEGIARDLGVHTDPDDFYAAQGTNLRGLRRLLFERWFRHAINRRVARIRARGLPTSRRTLPASGPSARRCPFPGS